MAAEYELEHLLLEGHCFDVSSGQPPRGLQFTLGTASEPVIVDTIVMANLVSLQPQDGSAGGGKAFPRSSSWIFDPSLLRRVTSS